MNWIKSIKLVKLNDFVSPNEPIPVVNVVNWGRSNELKQINQTSDYHWIHIVKSSCISRISSTITTITIFRDNTLQSHIILNSQRIQILHRVLLHNQWLENYKPTNTESTRYIIANSFVNREFCYIRRNTIPVVAVADWDFKSRN